MTPEQLSSIVREFASDPAKMSGVGFVTGAAGYFVARLVNAQFSDQERQAEQLDHKLYTVGLYAGTIISGLANAGLFWLVSEAVK